MARGPESTLKAVMCQWLKLQKIPYARTYNTGYGTGGIGDIILCIDGLYIELEVKLPHRRGEKNGGCSQMQADRIEEIRKGQGVAFVIYTLNELKDLITWTRIGPELLPPGAALSWQKYQDAILRTA